MRSQELVQLDELGLDLAIFPLQKICLSKDGAVPTSKERSTGTKA